jgi:hypothetical protein
MPASLSSDPHAAAVERFFESNKLLASRRRFGNVGI